MANGIEILDSEGAVIEVGDWCAGGLGEDADYGRVISVAEDRVMVAWEGSMVQTLADPASITLYTSRGGAEEAYESLARNA